MKQKELDALREFVATAPPESSESIDEVLHRLLFSQELSREYLALRDAAENVVANNANPDRRFPISLDRLIKALEVTK